MGSRLVTGEAHITWFYGWDAGGYQI